MQSFDPPGVACHDLRESLLAQLDHQAEPHDTLVWRMIEQHWDLFLKRQFQLAAPTFPTDFRYPDETFRDRLDLTIGGETIECHHARGETDDHVWLWVPGRRVLCTGDPMAGTVPVPNVIGKARFIVWPPSRWGGVGSVNPQRNQ